MYDVSRSTALLRRARKSEALIDARPGLYFSGYERIGGYPLFVERAEGAYIWDVDGNKYVDFLLGFGSVALGHAHPEIIEAVTQTLRRGVNPTLLSIVQIELAEKLVELIPAADCVTFLKTGSDAVAAAVRLARAVTGRDHIIQWGHHGWHDWCAVQSAGVPDRMKELVHPMRYNDLDHARHLFESFNDKIACIVMMPYEIEAPEPGFLQGLKELAHRNSALFILDEIRSGFRIALGGAQEFFNVEPDLATYGKAMANGHTLSVLTGRRDVMRHILEVGLTVTFYRSPEAMSAALSTIAVLERDHGPKRLAALGERLMRGLDEAARRSGVPACSVGLPATPFIQFNYQTEAARARATRIFCNGMLRQGVLLTPAHHWFVCTAMREDDIDHAVEAASNIFSELGEKLLE